jgi:hypothetical protein
MQPPKCPHCGKLLTEELADAGLSPGNSATVWCNNCERKLVIAADAEYIAAAVYGPIPRSPLSYN